MNRTPVTLALATLVLAALLGACNGSSTRSPTAPAGGAPPQPLPQPLTSRYEVTFEATWSRGSHPTDFPANAHFSPLVGATHDARVRFWGEGLLASAGIERMAELGVTSPLDDEIQRAIDAGSAGALLRGDPIGRSPGSASISFEATQSFSHVTLVTMVAPSPDWFVGVSGLDLFAGGVWAEQLVLPLYAWDAGTDDGVTFTSPDAEARPHQPVREIDSSPLVPPAGVPVALGRFVFRRTG